MKPTRDTLMRFQKTQTTEELFWEKVRKADGDACWEWQGSRSVANRYGQFSCRLTPTKTASLRAHRVMWVMVNGSIPPGMVVCHRCDNPGCVRPDHLFLGTLKDNARDCAAKGRMARQRNPYLGRTERKLTADKVRAIRAAYTGRYGQKAELARMYGVSATVIRHILTRKIWRQVA